MSQLSPTLGIEFVLFFKFGVNLFTLAKYRRFFINDSIQFHPCVIVTQMPHIQMFAKCVMYLFIKYTAILQVVHYVLRNFG